MESDCISLLIAACAASFFKVFITFHVLCAEAMATKAQQDMSSRAGVAGGQTPGAGRPAPQQQPQPTLQGAALQQLRGSPALAAAQVTSGPHGT